MKLFDCIKLLLVLVFVQTSQAAPLHIAVASNFEPTLNNLTAIFATRTKHNVIVSSGSTGQLFAQIKQGAPYDVFMSADVARPKLLVDAKLTKKLTVYAIGQLVLIANSNACSNALNSLQMKHLAIANPDLAPYGLAAKQYLKSEMLWDEVKDKLVFGNNAAQAFHMVISGNATAGIVPQSLLFRHPLNNQQCQTPLPPTSYRPIEQAMILLNRSEQAQLYSEFKTFLSSAEAQQILLNDGYLLASEE